MTTSLQIGDMVEIPLPKGFAYVQYTHESDDMGSVIRVMQGEYNERPRNLKRVARAKERFVTLIPLRIMVEEMGFKVAGNFRVPRRSRKFPLFRAAGLADPETGKVSAWWFWDGADEWKVGEITREQRRMPIRSIWNPQYLVEQIEEDWTPEKDSR